jgi:hypothetical protein
LLSGRGLFILFESASGVHRAEPRIRIGIIPLLFEEDTLAAIQSIYFPMRAGFEEEKVLDILVKSLPQQGKLGKMGIPKHPQT